MEISPIIIWNALLTLVYAPLIYGIRSITAIKKSRHTFKQN